MSENPDEKFHPIANVFPLMSEKDLDELAADIKTQGLLEPIWLHQDGRILDGRNRYRACLLAGVEPTYRNYEGDDPIAFVASMNLHRRHLDPTQRSLVAAKMANLKSGDNQYTEVRSIDRTSPISMADAAKLMDVSEPSVKRAKQVLASGNQALIEAVEKGEKSLSAAADEALDQTGRRRKKKETTKQATVPKEMPAKEIHTNGKTEYPPDKLDVLRKKCDGHYYKAVTSEYQGAFDRAMLDLGNALEEYNHYRWVELEQET
jgi:ParB-like chromosome segregation protein Spo0J